MATSRAVPQIHPALLARVQEARARTDALFALLPPNSFYERPVPERHRLIFYLGHLEAFDWNLLGRGAFELAPDNPELDKLINPLQKDLGLKKEGMNHFRNGLIARVWKVLANDKAYLNNVRSIRAKGDSVKTADYIHRAFIERLPEQFRLHRNEIYPNIGTKPKPAAGAQPNGEKKVVPINVTQGQRPRREQVDWVKTSDSMWIAGMAYLLDGKLVKGFKDAPANRY